ncbi:MAG TPA: GNAT family N-acetyltransferase [Candidatus Cybelea sp.]|nr:GNAT family N-acetyltransferase [Candidatus Cybelea sp.]
MTVEVRLAGRTGASAAVDREFVKVLGRRCVMSSVGEMRPASESTAIVAFDRLVDLVDAQSNVTLIAQNGERRIGFLLLLDRLPDEVTLLDQAFVAYMAVEPDCRRNGVGAALLAAAEEEARKRGLPHVALMVTEENQAARVLYERAGFRTERRLLCKPL